MNVVTSITCESIKDIILREQAIGQLTNIRDTKDWFAEFEKATQTLLKERNED